MKTKARSECDSSWIFIALSSLRDMDPVPRKSTWLHNSLVAADVSFRPGLCLCAAAHLACLRGSLGGWPIANTWILSSWVNSPSTRTILPSVKMPSPGIVSSRSRPTTPSASSSAYRPSEVVQSSPKRRKRCPCRPRRFVVEVSCRQTVSPVLSSSSTHRPSPYLHECVAILAATHGQRGQEILVSQHCALDNVEPLQEVCRL